MHTADQLAPTPRTDAAIAKDSHGDRHPFENKSELAKESRQLERELSASRAEAERLREALKHELNALNIILTRQRDGDTCRVSVSDLLQGIRMLEQALAATRKEEGSG